MMANPVLTPSLYSAFQIFPNSQRNFLPTCCKCSQGSYVPFLFVKYPDAELKFRTLLHRHFQWIDAFFWHPHSSTWKPYTSMETFYSKCRTYLIFHVSFILKFIRKIGSFCSILLCFTNCKISFFSWWEKKTLPYLFAIPSKISLYIIFMYIWHSKQSDFSGPTASLFCFFFQTEKPAFNSSVNFSNASQKILPLTFVSSLVH